MRKQGAGKFPALILYNEMMTVPGKNLFSQIGNQTVKNTCCKECADTLGNKIRQNAEVMVENTFCLSKDAQTAGCGGCSGQKYTSHVWPVSYTHLDVYKRQGLYTCLQVLLCFFYEALYRAQGGMGHFP